MKTHRTTLLLTLIALFVSCNQNDEPEIKPIEKIEISTDQNTFKALDNISYSIINKTSKEIIYWACQYQNDPNVGIQKKNQNVWETAQYGACPEFTWITMNVDNEKNDTIYWNWLNTGKYRLEFRFIINSKDTLLYSNSFEIID